VRVPAQHTPFYSDVKIANRTIKVWHRYWPLNEGQSPSFRGARVAPGAGYSPGERNRRNGGVSSSPTRNRKSEIRSFSSRWGGLLLAAPLRALAAMEEGSVLMVSVAALYSLTSCLEKKGAQMVCARLPHRKKYNSSGLKLVELGSKRLKAT
jgi:hypothetical protein